MSSDLRIIWLSRTSAFLAYYKVSKGTLTRLMIKAVSCGSLEHTLAFSNMTESKGRVSRGYFPVLGGKHAAMKWLTLYNFSELPLRTALEALQFQNGFLTSAADRTTVRENHT